MKALLNGKEVKLPTGLTILKKEKNSVDFKRLNVANPQSYKGGFPNAVNGFVWGEANIRALARQLPKLVGKYGRFQGHACVIKGKFGKLEIVHPKTIFSIMPLAEWTAKAHGLKGEEDWLEDNFEKFTAALTK